MHANQCRAAAITGFAAFSAAVIVLFSRDWRAARGINLRNSRDCARWRRCSKAAADSLRGEFLAQVISDQLIPYAEQMAGRSSEIESASQGSFYLRRKSELEVAENCRHCPQAVAVLQNLAPFMTLLQKIWRRVRRVGICCFQAGAIAGV